MRIINNQIPRRRRSSRHESGAQLAELAIVTPIFLLLLAAAAEFGMYFYTYNTLAKATRVGARYLTAKVFTDGEKTKARNLVVCGSLNTCTTGSEILSGLTTGKVSITSSGGTTFFPQTVTVQITGFSYQPLFDLGSLTGGDPWANVDVGPGTTMRYLLEN
jgi:Flp pilus assembly protein TadG